MPKGIPITKKDVTSNKGKIKICVGIKLIRILFKSCKKFWKLVSISNLLSLLRKAT